MNIALEAASLEQECLLLGLDSLSCMNPKSVGLEALEANLMGGTSISTEGLVDRVKERATKIFDRAKKYASRIMDFFKTHKVISAGIAAAVAIFLTAIAAKVASGKGPTKEEVKEQGKKLQEFAEKRNEETKLVYKRLAKPQGGMGKRGNRALAKAQARNMEAAKKIAERDALQGKEKQKIEKEVSKVVERTEKIGAPVEKIRRATTTILSAIKKFLSKLPNLLKSQKAEEKKAASTEGFWGDLGKNILKEVTYLVGYTLGLFTAMGVLYGGFSIAERLANRNLI